jgi:hypothetical protein
MPAPTSNIWYFIVVLTLIIAVVAIIVASVFASKNNSDEDPRYIIRTTATTQVIPAATETPMVFDTSISSTNDIAYTATGSVFTVQCGGLYNITLNSSVDVSGTGGPTPSPVSVWVHKAGSSIYYGLNQALPAQSTTSSTNSQYITLNTTISLVANETFTIALNSSLTQTLLGGATTYLAITRVSETC